MGRAGQDFYEAMDEDAGELLGKRRHLGRRRGGLQPDDQAVADPAQRVVVTVEAEDLARRLEDVVGDQIEAGVLRPDQAPGGHLFGHEPFPGVPVATTRHFQQDHGGGLSLARLQQGQELEGLVEGAETAGQHGIAVGFLDE